MKRIMVLILTAAISIVFIFGICYYIKLSSVYVNNSVYILNNKTVTIDAGHGGKDPGKVGKIKNEDDLNLIFSRKLRDVLSSMGAKVVMTRDVNGGLYEDGSAVWNKDKDMKKRREIIGSSNSDIMISIHMNSHTDNVSRGLQVFYMAKDEKSKNLANQIKNQTDVLDKYSKRRDIKPRGDLYILKNKGIPSVIVECGFISCPKEEKMLNNSYYQDKMCGCIAKGVAKYLLAK